MYHTIKSGDTLSKISKQFNIPVNIILSFNPEIKNINKIFAGQSIYIPNTDDVPSDAVLTASVNPTDLITRAKLVIGKGIRYKLGSGGMSPEKNSPATNNLCDCSGFVCWVLGISRETDNPFYKKFGGWIYTDSMEADVNSNSGIFERLQTPEIGAIVVYGAGAKIGHVGIVSEVSEGEMKKVIHCSAGNDRAFKDSIQETGPLVFLRPDAVWGRFAGI
jgi:LysM repeat protein